MTKMYLWKIHPAWYFAIALYTLNYFKHDMQIEVKTIFIMPL